MDEIALLGGLHEVIDKEIDKQIKEWIDKHNVNYYLLYPLAMIEIGTMEKRPEVVQFETMPTIFYLAVDKRNQMHIEEKHMITEYMMMYFIKENIHDGELDILTFWNEISNLRTKFEYIQCSNEFYEIPVGDDTILVEKADLKWKD